jgi:rare lipoprotein A (peptidoglycan hydrolase)
MVPLLLLATPQRAPLHGLEHHAGASRGRAGDSGVGLSTPWTVPVVFADLNGATAPQASTAAPLAVTDDGSSTRMVNVSFQMALSTTTTTTSPPPAPAVKVAPVVPVPDVVVAKPTPPPTPPAPQDATIGLATWYGSPAGTCASPTLVFGTVVTVTDLSTGGSVRCRVDDREARNPGRVVDLSPATFSQLAALHVGVVKVRLTW